MDYQKMAEKAKSLVTKNGRLVSLIQKSQISLDPSKPWKGNVTQEAELQVPGIQLLPNSVRIFDLSALGDASDLRGLVSISELVYIVFQGENDLRQYSVVRDNGVDYGITTTQALKPAGVTLLGYIGVRR